MIGFVLRRRDDGVIWQGLACVGAFGMPTLAGDAVVRGALGAAREGMAPGVVRCAEFFLGIGNCREISGIGAGWCSPLDCACARRGMVGGLRRGRMRIARMVPLPHGAVVRGRDDFSRGIAGFGREMRFFRG